MGKILYRIFKKVEAEGGVAARLKFAQTTKVSLEKVKKVKDRPEYIRKFQLLASQILEKDVNELFPAADRAAPKSTGKKPPKKTTTKTQEDEDKQFLEEFLSNAGEEDDDILL